MKHKYLLILFFLITPFIYSQEISETSIEVDVTLDYYFPVSSTVEFNMPMDVFTDAKFWKNFNFSARYMSYDPWLNPLTTIEFGAGLGYKVINNEKSHLLFSGYFNLQLVDSELSIVPGASINWMRKLGEHFSIGIDLDGYFWSNAVGLELYVPFKIYAGDLFYFKISPGWSAYSTDILYHGMRSQVAAGVSF
ncbi:hypothetical protein [Spirochaeta isovalerica]|uniref:Uncharacterized protein n=1 Tax=Spirochaeta isovalerica TaxID=150 RepID=A0A841R9N2_9SPIO|nr:hypothetical protein [Spirochaeta isovalerica]MBB6480476.1 hypothetical protein [Spirochaeta isovalerica]